MQFINQNSGQVCTRCGREHQSVCYPHYNGMCLECRIEAGNDILANVKALEQLEVLIAR